MTFFSSIRAAISRLMRFPQTYGYGGFGSWIDFFRGTRSEINYAAEVGDIQKLRQSSLVMTAVNWVGRRFPEAPVGVFDIDKDGKATEVLGHPITKALKRPNPFYSGKTMAKAIGLNWIISGNVYWRVFANSAGEPLAIWPIPFWMMEPRWDSPTQFIGWYDYIVDGTPIPLDVEEVIHFRDGIDPWNSRKGMSPLGALLREIYTDNEIGNFSAALMTNSGIPEFMLIPKEGATGMTSEERKFLKEEFDAMRSGANRGKAILATKGLEVQPLTFEPKKLDLTVLRDIPESRLASVIGIPASALGLNIGIKNNTYTNAKELGEDATEGYLVPLWDYFSEELTFYFQERGVLKENQEIRYKKNEVRALQEDKTDQFKRNSIAFQAGWMKRSEARVDANLPVDETIDDVYITDIKAEQQKVQAEMLADRVNKDGDPLMKYLMDGTPTDEEKVAMRESWIARVPREARGLYRSNGHAQT